LPSSRRAAIEGAPLALNSLLEDASFLLVDAKKGSQFIFSEMIFDRRYKVTQGDGVELASNDFKTTIVRLGISKRPSLVERNIATSRAQIPDLPSSAFQCQSYRISVPCSFEPRVSAARAFRLAAFVEKFRPRLSQQRLQS
jgi:hypothetical protein